MLIGVKALKGYRLDSLNGEIGTVKDFYFDDRTWAIRYLVANAGNWLKKNLVLISPRVLVSIVEQQKNITVNLSQNQIRNSPSAGTDGPVEQSFEKSYAGPDGWPMCWRGSEEVHSFLDFGIRQNSDPTREHTDCQHRSTEDVTGYHIEAVDGSIGHVADFIVDDETWEIRYLVIDTTNWGPGKKVLISPGWIEKVSWIDSRVFVNLPCSTIEHAQGYTDVSSLNREYEAQMFQHYQRRGYWEEALDEITRKF